MIKNFAELIDRLLQDPVKKKVAVVCAQDEHTLEAVIKAYKEKLISPVLIVNYDKVRHLATPERPGERVAAGEDTVLEYAV